MPVYVDLFVFIKIRRGVEFRHSIGNVSKLGQWVSVLTLGSHAYYDKHGNLMGTIYINQSVVCLTDKTDILCKHSIIII